MRPELAVALSLAPSLSRVGLTARLRNPDPALLELAEAHLPAVAPTRERWAPQGVFPLPWNAPAFPPLLLAIPDCPPALWCRGEVGALDAPTVAVVGSRSATAVALEVAASLSADLAALGVTVVSGLARGVDSAAHRGALAAGRTPSASVSGCAGRTVAVLGCGPDRIYPAEHGGLATDILSAGGLLLSEYPPGTPPLPFRFPQRNRLISGLSRAVVVVEAAAGSGSLITAACALEQGREVMAVPGNPLTGRNRGGHALLRDGARLVEGADDVVSELGLLSAVGSPDITGATARPRPTDPVAAAMDVGEPYDLDTLTAALGLPGHELLARLLQLELQGIVRRAGGGRFIRPGRTC